MESRLFNCGGTAKQTDSLLELQSKLVSIVKHLISLIIPVFIHDNDTDSNLILWVLFGVVMRDVSFWYRPVVVDYP